MSWRVKPLGELAETQLGKMLNSSKQTGLHSRPYLRNVNVQWGWFDMSDVKSMDIFPDEESKFLAQKGDLLICEGGEVGRCAIWNQDEPVGIQNAVHRVRVGSDLDTIYLGHYLQHLALAGGLERFSSGVTIKHLTQEKLRRIPIAYPPMDEQKRIVAQLEDQLGKLETVGSALLQADERIGLLGRVLLNRMLTDLASYAPSAITEVCEVYQPRTISKKDLDPSGDYPVYGANGPIGMYGDFNHEHSEVTITCRGATSGTVNVIPAKAWITGNAMVVSPKDESISKGFLAAVLSATDMRPFISGTAQPQITRNSLRSLMVPIPDRESQAAFLEELEAGQASLVHLDSTLSAVVSQVDSARSSILHRAFLAPEEAL
jgi:restriction endonuclease S subunit